MFLEILKPEVSHYFQKIGEIDRIALNTPVQGTAAQITKLAGIYLFEELKKRNLLFKVLICNIVHDEILIECPEEIATEMAELVQNSMEKAGEYFVKVVKLKAVPEIGKYWIH